MILLGHLNMLSQEVWLVIMGGECSQSVEVFIREGNAIMVTLWEVLLEYGA